MCIRDRSNASGNESWASWLLPNTTTPSSRPVSYTHLDVYKRQTIVSTVPGDVIAVSIDSTNSNISSVNTLSINLQLFAGIPSGGKVSIYLPSLIVPANPNAIECSNIYGFTFTDSNPPTCTYNSTLNRVDTVNFNTPYFDSTGNGIISLKVINPLDSRPVNFSF